MTGRIGLGYYHGTVESRDILKLVKKDRQLAEEELDRLSPEEQTGLFLRSTDRGRLDLVEISRRPKELLAAIPATEVWYTIKRLTPPDALTIIKYASPEQIQVICDIECWQKDRFDSGTEFMWMEHIAACGISKIMEWFSECDWDQIELFFKQNIVVFKREDKEEDPANIIDWPREEAPITHEGIYYFQVLNKKRDELIRYFMEILVKHDMKLYNTLCESCIWDIPSVREEEAYEVRSRRLAEHGFPSFDDAIGIYSPLPRSKFKFAPKRDTSKLFGAAPRYPLVVLGDRVLFINHVMKELDPEFEDRFLIEAATIANKLLIADGENIDEETMDFSLIKAFGYINIGLEVLSEGNVSKAASFIKSNWLTSIFQVGLAEVMRLSREAKDAFEKGWMKGNKELLENLNDELRIQMENLIIKRPKFFAGDNEYVRGGIRDFVTLDELDIARRRLNEAVLENPSGKEKKDE